MPDLPTPPRLPRDVPERLALALAVVAAALPRFLGIGWSLPSLFEEATPFRTAWQMWGFAPLQRFDLNPHWFTYPSLVFYLQMAGQALTFAWLRLTGAEHSMLDLRARWFLDPTPYVLVARSITALFGVATVLPVWSIARRAAGPGAAFLAATIVALHPDLIAKSQVIEVDVPLAFFMALAVDRALAAIDRPTARRWVVTGAVAGLATATKYPGLVLLAPLAVAAWLSARAPGSNAHGTRPGPKAVPAARREAPRGRRRDRPAAHAPSPRRTPPAIAVAASRLAIATLVLAIVFFLTSPFVILDWKSAAQDYAEGRDLMTAGHFGVAAGRAYATYARDWFQSLMGWPLGIASLVALAFFAMKRRPWALLMVAIFLPFVAVVGSWEMKADRYLIPLLPLAAIAGAAGLRTLARLAEARVPRLRPWLFAGFGLLALLPLLARLPDQRRTLGTDTRTLARLWIEKHFAPGSMIASEVYGPELVSPVRMQMFDSDVLREIARRGKLARVYALQTVPMYVLRPERSAKYYDLARLREADALIVSSAVRERYRGEPARYAAQLRFYEELERRWPRVASFAPRGGAGPALSIHRNPEATIPFASRTAPAAVDTTIATRGELSGSEGYWYFNLGINHEFAGQADAARECYLIALRFGPQEPDTYVHASLRLASLLHRQGHARQALAMLRLCAERAPGPVQAETLHGALLTLASGGEICAPVGR